MGTQNGKRIGSRWLQEKVVQVSSAWSWRSCEKKRLRVRREKINGNGCIFFLFFFLFLGREREFFLDFVLVLAQWVLEGGNWGSVEFGDKVH